MTLTSRLSLFFLAALAVVLAGFSATLYVLAHLHLHHQVEERCRAALDTLHAAIEMEEGALEWAAQDRRVAPGASGPLSWAVFDGQGRRIDGSDGDVPPTATTEAEIRELRWRDQAWLVGQRRLLAEDRGKPGEKLPPNRYRVLVLTAAAPLAPVQGALQTLALVLIALSLGLWTAAALVGRRLCRRALAPLTRMAGAARTLGVAEPGWRLPTAGTRDELDDLGREFNALLARLEESFARQRRFTGEASHQLRTPLTAMLGQVEVALRRDRSPDEYRTVLSSVRRQVDQLHRLIEMLLFLARADAEAQVPEREPLDLADWLHQRLVSWDAHPRRGDFQVEFDAPPLPALVHEALLGQALDNLLDNACKYSEPGSPIVVRARRRDAEILLEVEDHGSGVAAADLPHLFEPFFRSPEARRRGVSGVGLGLAITARIAAVLGGRVEADSRPGEGSRFSLILPTAPPGGEPQATCSGATAASS
jgi:heavy metal sensor kinase